MPASPCPDPPCSPAVERLLDAVPEFVPHYLDLVADCDEDPGSEAVFAELAEFVAARLAEVERQRPVLERTLAAVDAVVEEEPDALVLVGYAFLDGLSPDDRRLIAPWLAPSTRTLLEGLDAGVL